MDVSGEIIDVDTPDGVMAVVRKRPVDAGPWPKVAMFHDGPGVRTATHVFAEKLAGEGFDVVVPDLYHREGRLIGFDPEQRAADPSIADRMRALLATLTDEGIQSDLDAALAAVGAAPDERLLTIGFCLGGRAVFRTLERLPDRFVGGSMWHPSFLVDGEPDSPHRHVDALRQPLYVGVGAADAMQGIEVNGPFFDAVEPLPHVEVEIHPGADHGYTWPDHPTYDAGAAERSFARTVALFRGALAR